VAVPPRLANKLIDGLRCEREIEPAIEHLEVGALLDLVSLTGRDRQAAPGENLQHRLGLAVLFGVNVTAAVEGYRA